MFARSIRAAAITIVLFSAAACSDNSVTSLPVESASLTITPPTVTVYEADAVVLTAVYRDAAGGVVPNAQVTWAVNDTLRAMLGANGYILALKNGVVKVTATCNGVSANYNLTIVRPPVQNVAVLLSTPIISRGDVATFGVRSDGPGGRVVLGRAVTLASDNPNIAMIDAAGRIRAVSQGVTTIRATVDGVTGSAQLQVRGGNTLLNLSKFDGSSLPLLIAMDTVMWYGVREVHEVYVETGTFAIGGTPMRYEIDVVYREYAVMVTGGQRRLEPRTTQHEYDRGLVVYDARGDLQLTSEIISPLSHVAFPVSGGMELNYRVPGDDQILRLFFRREPE